MAIDLLEEDSHAARHHGRGGRRGDDDREHNLDDDDGEDQVEEQEGDRAEEPSSGHGVVARASGSPAPAAYNSSPGRFPTTPRATNKIDSANAAADATPARAKNQTNAACDVPRPLMVTGSSMISRIRGMKAK